MSRVTSGRRTQAFELALLGGLALLHLAPQVSSDLVLCSFDEPVAPPDTVTPRATAQHDDLVARDGLFAADVFSLHGTDHGTDFKALGHIVVVVNLAHMGRCQPDLIAVTGVAAAAFFEMTLCGSLPSSVSDTFW